eukprot:808354-Amphidinium_carterae.1
MRDICRKKGSYASSRTDFRESDVELLQRWLTYGADLQQHMFFAVGDYDTRCNALEFIADSARPGCTRIAKLLAEHGARISFRAVSKLLLIEDSDWKSFWETLTSVQLQKAVESRFSVRRPPLEVSPPLGMLDWCTEEWRSATAFRRQYSLQSWHSWYIASLPNDWHFHELRRAREDPWAGTLVPRLLAALAAGCRGQLVET